MSGHISSEAIGIIIDNYADVIEGGSAYAGGTSYRGIPGTRSNDDGLRNGSDGSFTTSGAGSTTTLVYASGSWDSTRWVKENTPAFFAIHASQNAARRITGWNNTTKQFTVDAFPAAPGNAASIIVRQGFKRLPNSIDIDDDDTGSPSGFDRFFSISLEPEKSLEWYGSGVETWLGKLTVKLRILKYGRAHDARKSAAENITIIASAMTIGASPNHRETTYTRALLRPESGPEIEEDNLKYVASISFPIIYRIARTFD